MNCVVVRLGDLRDSASKLGPRRVPAGFRGSIPRTTEIKPDADGISVETPYVETAVPGDGRWEAIVSVDCRRLPDTLLELKRRWKDIGGDEARITLSSSETTLEFAWSDAKGTRRYTIPLVHA